MNTRMRDFYDIFILLDVYEERINTEDLKLAFDATCKKRETLNFKENGKSILSVVKEDSNLNKLWNTYQKKYSYAQNISFDEAVNRTEFLLNMII